MKKILLALTLFASTGFAALTEVDKSLYTEKNLLPNPGFENGKNTWLSSNATLTATAVAADVLDGAASGSILISTNGGYARSKTVAVPTSLYSALCEAHVLLKGGDALTTLEVYDRDNTLLGSQTLTANVTPTFVTALFTCPTAAAVAGDADKGFIYTQIKQTSAGTHTIVYTDNWYLGRRVVATIGDGTVTRAKLDAPLNLAAPKVMFYSRNISQAETYTRTGTLVTVTTAGAPANGTRVYLDFTTGTAVDGMYTTTYVSPTSYTLNTVASGSTSGAVTRKITELASVGVASFAFASSPANNTIQLVYTTPFTSANYFISAMAGNTTGEGSANYPNVALAPGGGNYPSTTGLGLVANLDNTTTTEVSRFHVVIFGEQ